MRSRRFVVLVVVLLGVNLTLWLAPPGLALRRALVLQLFGDGKVKLHRRSRRAVVEPDFGQPLRLRVRVNAHAV